MLEPPSPGPSAAWTVAEFSYRKENNGINKGWEKMKKIEANKGRMRETGYMNKNDD